MSKETVNVGVGLHNRFDFEVRDLPEWYRRLPRSWWPRVRKTVDAVCGVLSWRPEWLWGRVSGTALAENVVLNQAFTHLLAAWATLPALDCALLYSDASKISLGSGTTAPAVTQTALVTPVYSAAANRISVTNAVDQMSGNFVKNIVIDAGQRVGDVYREVGAANSAGSLETRALIKDGNGDPLTITKADLQVVTINATIFWQVSHAYGPNMMFIGIGTSFTVGPYMTCAGFFATAFGSSIYQNNGGQSFMQFGSSNAALALANATTAGRDNACITPIPSAGSKYSVGSTGLVVDAANKKVTFSYRLPSTISGTIREIGFLQTCSDGSPHAIVRMLLPIGSNSPTYDNVYNQASITKNAANVVDVSFVLQFGSL